jgi:hypothetical protein
VLLVKTFSSVREENKLIRSPVPRTGLYIHTAAATDPNDLASFPAAFALLKERYGDKATTEADLEGDQKTLEAATSTPLFGLLSPSLDGMLLLFES